MSQNKTLILGGSGQIGKEVIKFLSKDNYSLRVTSSKNLTSDQPNLEYVQYNVLNSEKVDSLFAGVDKAFFMVPAGLGDQYSILKPLLDSAIKAKLKKIVLLTAMGADADPTGPYALAEQQLIKSGINYNIVRPNWFMQNFTSFWLAGIKNDQKIYVAAKDAKTSFIDTRDISEVIATLLSTDRFDNQAFVLTGTESLTHNEVANILTEVTNKKIDYINITSEDLANALKQAGMKDDFVAFFVLIQNYLAEGYNSATTDNVELILGRKPRTFLEFARDHKAHWV